MKRTILLVAIALFISTATAVVEGPEPDDREMSITSTGSSTLSSTVKMQGRNSNITNGDRVENISHSGNGTTFSGYIQAPTPCHVIDQETEKLGDQNYRMNVQTVKDNESQICTQQVVMIEYDGSFEAEAPYSLEIQHNNETVDTLENAVEEEPTEESNGGIFDTFFKWLGDLF